NDNVKVISGKDKGKTGRVLDVIPERGLVLVEHVAMIKRATRPNPAKQIKGGMAERESPIHVSNVMLIGSDGKPTRIGMKVDKIGKKERRVRIGRKTGEIIAAPKGSK
ncbi:MAG TPA: 50S ribosomal protein L24, partial [Bryobacteraceae bacterium]